MADINRQKDLFDDEQGDYKARVFTAVAGYRKGNYKQGRTYKRAGRTIDGTTLFNVGRVSGQGGRRGGENTEHPLWRGKKAQSTSNHIGSGPRSFFLDKISFLKGFENG